MFVFCLFVVCCGCYLFCLFGFVVVGLDVFGCFGFVCFVFLFGRCFWVEFYCFGVRFDCCIGVGLLGVLDGFVFCITRVCSGFELVCRGYVGVVMVTLFSFGVWVFGCWIVLFWCLVVCFLYLIVCCFDFVWVLMFGWFDLFCCCLALACEWFSLGLVLLVVVWFSDGCCLTLGGWLF